MLHLTWLQLNIPLIQQALLFNSDWIQNNKTAVKLQETEEKKATNKVSPKNLHLMIDAYYLNCH